MKRLFGGMETGGTKFVCAVGNSPGQILAEVRIPTTSPGETISQGIAFFRNYDLAAIGIASFGPLDLDPSSPTYGSITATPKPGWAGTNLLALLKQEFDLPVAIDTDVNAAAFGEHDWIAVNRPLESLVYFTIGTGIGAGFFLNGKLIHGLTHPETGHMRIPHDRKRDPFPGICPFHGDCFEGLASGVALARRWRKPAELLPATHPAWELEAAYIAVALANVILTTSPQRIILGGGVMNHQALFPAIREQVRILLNGYVASPAISGEMEDFIVPPGLGTRSGVLGAIALAKHARG